MTTGQDDRTVQPKPTVLIVDDDMVLGSGLILALGIEGYAPVYVSSGVEALALLAEGLHPQIVVLDVMMPEVDGWEVLSRIRQNALIATVPVIMLTARDDVESKERGFGLGADDYLTKPFAIKELRCRLRALLKRTNTGVDNTGAIAVLASGGGHEFVSARDVYYVEGIRNCTYVHAYDRRFLCNASLGSIEQRELPGLMRVHRSYIVNLDRIAWCGWGTRSAFRLRLSDADATELSVSRNLAVELQRRMGLK